MQNETAELLEAARYKEIASQTFYETAQRKTRDTGAQALLKELAGEEAKHSRWLEDLTGKNLETRHWHRGKVQDLKLSSYLVAGDTIEGAGLQDTLAIAIKREQQSIEFYLGMMDALREKTAKHLCESLIQEELRHKLKLEMLYDDIFYQEN